jgi:N-glycosylase/DNA lyase
MMVQKVFGLASDQIVSFELPEPETPLMRGIVWGRHDEYYTPAYWAAQTRIHGQGYVYRLGETLIEEAAACLLGGHGIPAAVGLAAFKHLKARGLLSGDPINETRLFEALTEPLKISDRTVRYRFARQKASYLAPVLRSLRDQPPVTHDHRRFRAHFLQFSGIGLKTASWITRNWLNSQQVAILDIHIHRAGLICGLFPTRSSIARDYLAMEAQFLAFARALGVEPSRLDAVIWAQMKESGRSIFKLLPPQDRVVA